MDPAMQIYWVFVSLVLAIAMGRGGLPEQLAAAILLGASGLSLVAVLDTTISFRGFEWRLFTIDVLSFSGFLALALKANRRWPSCIAGMKLLPVFGHVAKAVDPTAVSAETYAILGEVWSYLYMLVILAGVVRHQLRLHRHAEDRPWRQPVRQFAGA
jgi:hypothetical protein